MGLFSYFLDSIRGTDPSEWLEDLEIPDVTANRLYLKYMAKDTVLNFVARTMSTAKVKFKTENKEWDYILNVRPNKDMSASDFWQAFFYRLLDDNEVLAIKTDDNQLLIADDFNRNKYAVFEDTFDGVTVKGYTFQRTFVMSDVIYLSYNNAKLDHFAKSLFEDYSELFGRILEVAMRNNQIRATVGIDQTQTFNDKSDKSGMKKSERMQKFVNKIFNAFSTKSVAIVPKLNGFTYEEHTNKQGSENQSLDDLTKMVTSLIDDIANAVGVPTALLYGEKSELDQNLKAYHKLCIDPLVIKLERELTAKILTKNQYKRGERLEVKNVLPKDPIENAVQIDKMVSSGAFYVDEVRGNFDYDELPDDQGKVLRVTKNYEEATKGGEDENDETQENNKSVAQE